MVVTHQNSVPVSAAVFQDVQPKVRGVGAITMQFLELGKKISFKQSPRFGSISLSLSIPIYKIGIIMVKPALCHQHAYKVLHLVHGKWSLVHSSSA